MTRDESSRASAQRLPLFWLALCALLYVTTPPLYQYGYFIDDALYVSLSQSLLHGQYVTFFSAHPSAYVTPPPGYPLLLAPFVALFGPASPALLFSSVLFSLISIGLFSKILLSIDFSTTWIPTLFFLLFAWNHVLFSYSKTVMAEPAYLCFALGVLWFLTHEEIGFSKGMIAVLAAACFIRPHGVFLAAAVSATALTENNKRAFLRSLLAFVPLGLFYVRNGLVGGSPADYVGHIRSAVAQQGFIHQGVAHLKPLMGTLFPGVVFGWPVPSDPWARAWVAWGSILVGGALIGVGAYAGWHRRIVRVSLFTIVFCLAGLLFWVGIERRYLLMILPFVLVLFSFAVEFLSTRRARAVFFLLFVAALYGQFHAIAAIRQQAKEHPATPARETLQWIALHTRRDDILVSPLAPVIFAYTQRKAELLPLFETKASFERWMDHARLRYVVLSHAPLIGPNGRGGVSQTRMRQWLLDSSQATLLFTNTSEQTEIYRWEPSPLSEEATP